MTVDGKTLPNNPMKAYMMGKLQGTRENMDMVAMVLCDKCGFHIREESADTHDTMSIEYLYNQIVELTKEINAGRIKRKDIKSAIAEDYKVVFDD